MGIETIASPSHPLVRHLARLRADGRYRVEQGSFWVEGRQLVEELGRRHPMRRLVMRLGEEPPAGLSYGACFALAKPLFQKISPLDLAAEMGGEFLLPQNASLQGKRRLLALDGLSDPGNVGSLLRTAYALGVEGVFMTEGSVDLFNDKVIRAARGAPLYLPFRVGGGDELCQLIADHSLHVYVGDITGLPLPAISWRSPSLLILGHETRGVSPSLKARGTLVRIPMVRGSDSLNVAAAGAILLYASSMSLLGTRG